MKYNGGLGNQMFQFAAAATAAMRLGCEFSFDMSFFSRSYSRPYQINIFQTNDRSSNDKRTKLYWTFRRLVKKDEFMGLNIYRESSSDYEQKFEQIKDNTFIEGFFQSYKYIDEELIKKYFTYKISPDAQNEQLISELIKQESISLHIRRGDYVSKKRYQNVYNHLDTAHYEAAMELAAKNTNYPVFYVFSDDIEWAKENLNFQKCPTCKSKNAKLEFVCHNSAENSWEDMRLMSNCMHNIIANSSFSWWGAYLNSNPEKMVIAPKKWYNDPKKTTKDIYPPQWITL